MLVFLVQGLITLGSLAATFHILRRRTAKQGRRALAISRMSGLVIGAMLISFQAIVQPEARGRIVEQQKEDDTGAGLPGSEVFRRQLGQIQKGEDVETLTVQRDE